MHSYGECPSLTAYVSFIFHRINSCLVSLAKSVLVPFHETNNSKSAKDTKGPIWEWWVTFLLLLVIEGFMTYSWATWQKMREGDRWEKTRLPHVQPRLVFIWKNGLLLFLHRALAPPSNLCRIEPEYLVFVHCSSNYMYQHGKHQC